MKNSFLDSNQEYLLTVCNGSMTALIEFPPLIGEDAIKDDLVFPVSTLAAI
jgi:hypothetical protein